MSSRGGRRRGRPPKSSYTTPHVINPRSSVIEKPKWLQSRDGYLGEYAATGSRASSPGGSVNSFSQQYSAKKHISVTPFKKRGRKAGTRGNRGGKSYVPRPSLTVSRRRDDYHYGSDYDSDSDSDGPPSPADDTELDVESDVDIPMSEPESDHLEESDSDYSVSNQSLSTRKSESSFKPAPTPLPFWLQTDQHIPDLELPKSSEDLLLPANQVLSACAIYEVLRKFSSEVRLSPFRLEDFLGALQSEELTPLLAEVHVQLLKAMLREEDVQQTWFGPLDQKDSTNSMLHFNDTLTWPEVMRVFLQSDRIFEPALTLLESCEYPFTTCDIRLQVLKFLSDHFLSNTAVRQEILSEGNIKYNDHCRVCHKVGDLLCCETCPAVYHLHCLDPPLENVPNEDWQCPICTAQICKGVTDCVSDAERSGFLCRQDCLGFDRHGRKYWFIARRIFVEENCDENGEIKTDEISKKTWYYSSPFQFEQLLSILDKSEYERALCQELYNLRPEILRQMAITVQLTNEFKGTNKSYLEAEEEAARAVQEATIKGEKLEDEEQPTVDVVKTEDEKIETAEEVVEECGVEADDDFMQQLRNESEEKPNSENDQTAESQSGEESSSGAGTGTYATRTKTGTIIPRTYTDTKRKSSTTNGANTTIKEESSNGRKSKSPLPPDVIFKLGMEGRYKHYINQYSTNPLALNKNQASEERDRKRHLSHKFSLTGAAEFKWSGNLHGTRASVLQTVRSTLLQLHSQIPSMFMHPNWSTMRKPWITAVNACVSARDLGHVLSVLVACIRPVVFNGVWHESLGHVRLQRQTALEREEKKKIEKKEKKDKELEEEMHRTHSVHYTKGLKHQIWKHKGEEFRLHGQWGWRWLSATRPIRRSDARNCGLRAGPWKIVTLVHEEGEEPKYHQTTPEQGVQIYEIPLDDPDMELVDVTAALLDSNRRVYPKVAKKGKLDTLLEWRVKLKNAEEKNLLKVEKPLQPLSKADEETEVDIEGDNEPKAKLLSTEAAEARLDQLHKHKSIYRCYYSKCDGNNCYSPVCRSIAPLEARIAKCKAEEEKRKAEAVQKRMYSNDSTKGLVFLRRILPEDEARAKKKKVPVKYPMMSRYMTKSKKRTIFVLPDHELRHLARRYGQGFVLGYHHGSKNNSSAWIYPSARPLFKTCWFYRTTGLHSLSAAALQLRILWACLKWEEMLSKTSTIAGSDGKNQTTTDTEIVTTDILKHRHVGRFLERTQYYQRRVVIPLDVPKTVREVTPSRSGLRKRKMVEAPRLSQPIVSEEWVDEDRLELWVIKHYHERQERAAAAGTTTPSSTMTRLKTATQTTANGKSLEDIKAQLRNQRVVNQLKSVTTTPGTPGIVRVAVPGKAGATPGDLSIVTTPGSATGTPVTRRILITKDGKTSQILKTAAPGAVQPVVLTPSPGVAAATPATNKLQITRGPDGKIQIRGLQPGQQLIRLGDGRFSIVSPSPTVMAAQPAPVQVQATPTTANDGTAAAPKTIILQKAAVAPGQKPTSQIIVPAGTNTAAIAQQLASGKLQLGTVNGQQVLIQTAATPVTTNAVAAPAAPATAKPTDTPTTPTATATAMQPKQAVILQTPQGQRIVVQNLQGGVLTPQQLAAIQSQVLSRANLGAGNKPVTISVRTAPATPAATTTAAATTTSTPSSGTVATVVSTGGTTTETSSAVPGSPEKGFVVTPDFIQQTIRKALKQENLAPEIEQKLLQLQRFQEKQKTGGTSEIENAANYMAATARKRTSSDASWTEETEPITSTPSSITPRPSARKVVRTIEPPTAPAKSVNELSPASKEAAELREQKNKERAMKAQQRNKERRQQAALARLQGVLVKHSELLKKEMLRKRALLEKELRMSVQKEISALRLPTVNRTAVPEPQQTSIAASPAKKELQQTKQEEPVKTPPRSQKRRRASSPDKTYPPITTPKAPVVQLKEEPSPTGPLSGKKKRKQNTSESASSGKKKLYCICRTPYDNSKFYVGCDICSNWFHGNCVGITEAMSQKMSEFICDGCRKENGSEPELYCLCRQPYDEAQFYICCDRCQDWFHGRCVGVLQSESDSIDEYKCPKCEPQSPFNYANTRTLSPRDYEELRKLLRQLQSHKSSWPFREPVNAKEVPDYYQIIKDPMDLRMIENKIQDRGYQTLLEFIADVTKIFDNCRYYNAKESNIARCATTLETFFVPRLKSLRASMAN